MPPKLAVFVAGESELTDAICRRDGKNKSANMRLAGPASPSAPVGTSRKDRLGMLHG